MDELIIQADEQILLWVNSHHSAYWDYFMYAISGRLIWVPLYAAMLYAIFLSYGWRTMLLMGLITALAVTAADQICATVLRPVFQRMRPANLDNPISALVHIVDGYRGGRFGFPSCHAANTFAVAVLNSFFFKRWQYTLFLFLWAALICYSRMYLGVHYPGDITAGLIVGSLLGLLAYMLMGLILWSFVQFNGTRKEARRIKATYQRGAPVIQTCLFGRLFSWQPPAVAIYTGMLTFVATAVAAAFFH